MEIEGFKACVAGYTSNNSLWIYIIDEKIIAYSLVTKHEPEKANDKDTWLSDHMLVIKTTEFHTQKTSDKLPHLTFTTGARAINAVQDYNIYELALALTSHHAWQLVNGAKILPYYGELAKVYVGIYALFLFKTQLELKNAVKTRKGNKA